MIKEIVTPFDLEKAKQGAKLVTSEGYPARIICWDCDSEDYKIVALVHVDGRESPVMFMENGMSYMCGSFKCKLQIIEEVEVSDKWRDRNEKITDYAVTCEGKVVSFANSFNDCVSGYATEKEALREYASRKISHIIANDKRYGGPLSYWDWQDNRPYKYTIERYRGRIIKHMTDTIYTPLAFHTMEQRDLFYEENQDLLKQYFML